MRACVTLAQSAIAAGVLSTFVGGDALASDHCVRAGATGDGSDWSNALGVLPQTLVRGDTYWIADGTYGPYTFDDAGAALITLNKATAASHGPSTGWSAEYGDGQAIFGGMHFVTGHYRVDGQTRNEEDWQEVGAYGFRNTGGIYSSALSPGPACADDLTIRYMDIGGAPIGNTFSESNPDTGIYMGGFGDLCERWMVSRCHIHNVTMVMQGAGTDGSVIEHNHLGPAWQKEAIRGQIRMSNTVIRHNTIKDACQYTPGDPSSGCTAEIAAWGETGSGLWDGNEIYGNVIQKTTDEHNSGGAIVIGGDGTSWVGSPAANTRIYNNTIVGIAQGMAIILVNGGAGNEIRNNVWSDLGGSVIAGANATTSSNNVEVGTSAFVDYPDDLRLSAATAPGIALPSPYDVDRDDAPRGSDGVWDLGAYEYRAGGEPAFVFHPADSDQNRAVSIDEASSFSSCWRTGCAANATLDNAVRAATLARSTSDGRYNHDPGVACPSCWTPAP